MASDSRVLYVLLILSQTINSLEVNGGWSEGNPASHGNIDTAAVDEGPCTIGTIEMADLTQEDFLEKYAYKVPVIINMDVNNKNEFHEQCSKQKLLSKFGDSIVRLSTANTYSYAKFDVPLKTYIETMMKPQNLQSLGNETYYYFGDNNHTEWKPLFDLYQLPPYHLPRKSAALSFGIAASGTGVPFHFHGPGFGEVIYGRKRWFLYAPELQPKFDPDKSTLHWAVTDLALLEGSEVPLQCTLTPGQIIYFPDHWWHATLNLDTSVFMSVFLG